MIHPPSPREGIGDTLARYCRGIDRRDRALVRDCFTSSATDDHGAGPRPIEEFLDWCFELLAGYDATFHLLGQSSFAFGAEDRCAVETYGIAHHRRAGGADHRNLVTGFRYLDAFELAADGVWRVQRRVAVTDWSRVDREADWWGVADHILQGRPGPDDPSYHQ